MNPFSFLYRKLRPVNSHKPEIREMLEMCLSQQERLFKEHEVICRDVVTVINASNQLHIFQRHTIQALAAEFQSYKHKPGVEMGVDVNVM